MKVGQRPMDARWRRPDECEDELGQVVEVPGDAPTPRCEQSTRVMGGVTRIKKAGAMTVRNGRASTPVPPLR